MSRSVSLAAAAARSAAKAAQFQSVADQENTDQENTDQENKLVNAAESLLPPAIKGVALGFVGGVVAIVALMLLAPRLVHADEMDGAGQGSVGAASVKR